MICHVFYLEDGLPKIWAVDAHPTLDSDASIREHLERWLPCAEYLGHCFGEMSDILSKMRAIAKSQAIAKSEVSK